MFVCDMTMISSEKVSHDSNHTHGTPQNIKHHIPHIEGNGCHQKHMTQFLKFGRLYQEFSLDFPSIFPRCSVDFPSTFLRFSLDFPLIFPRFPSMFPRFPLDFPSIFLRFSIDFPSIFPPIFPPISHRWENR